ncbi:MAG: Nif3-like dinuclear metal center hexameric protein [Promethearchaeia archaeon]
MSALNIISFIEHNFASEYYNLNKKFFGLEYQPKNSIDDYLVHKILVTLTLSYKSLIFAIKNKINLIITYFGLLEKPISRFDDLLIKKLNLLSKLSPLIYTLNSSIICSEYGTSATLGDILYLKIENLFKIHQDKDNIPIGRICIPKKYPISNKSFLFENLIKRVKNIFELNNIRYSGDLNQNIERICIIAAKITNIRIIKKVFDSRCDCLISCNIRTKQLLFAKEINLCIIDIPFFKILYLTLKKFHKVLSLEFPKKKVFFFELKYPMESY